MQQQDFSLDQRFPIVSVLGFVELPSASVVRTAHAQFDRPLFVPLILAQCNSSVVDAAGRWDQRTCSYPKELTPAMVVPRGLGGKLLKSEFGLIVSRIENNG